MGNRACSVDECDAPTYGRGMCQRHYRADYYRRNAERHRVQAAAWRAENADKIKAQDAAYYARNRDRVKARSAEYRKAHPEQARATVAAWAHANPERKRELDAAYAEANADRIKARRAAYIRANRDKSRQWTAKRKALKLERQSEPVDYVAILDRHGMVCHICADDILSRDDLHFDHVIPLSRGGAHSEDNIRPTHAFCNLSKGARVIG